ncbi:transposase family protein [Streptomyces sp. BE147]|uniref:helix-turn-helix domain-containing protein n=1 Tax=Streptomyces sp. BE147 TaxID=3002524 RepID=UPI002E76A8B4|nr:transposase family protein [Streptomyces sp. BE147]MEE1736191.1 transposase family protein [Streptomyces sp. BE147]
MITELVAEVGPLWHERHQAALTARPRRRAVGAGAKHKPVLVESLLSTLVHLRHGATHDVLARWFGVDRSTITRATSELRPLPAQRDRAATPDIRSRPLVEVIDHLGHRTYAGSTRTSKSRPPVSTLGPASPRYSWISPTRLTRGGPPAARPGATGF